MLLDRPGSRAFRFGILLSLFALASDLGCAHGPSRKEREAAEIHYNLGVEALRTRRTREALREFDQAIASDENLAEAHMGRGLAHEHGFGKMAEAERDYRRALSLRPDYPEAHNNLGQLLARTGRLEEAIREFDLALDNLMYREPYAARCNKGQALYRLGKREEGLAQIGSCISLQPRYCQGHRMLGLIRLEEGRSKEALEALGRYAELCDKAPDAWLQLGLAHMKAGGGEKAREAFDRCEEIGAEDPAGEECRKLSKALR